MLTIRRQKRPIHQTVRQHLLKRIRKSSKIHLLHLPLPVVLPNPQMVRQRATRRMPQQGLLLAIPLMTEPKRRLRLILLLKGAKNDSSTEADQSPAKANVQVAATALGGRDFEGQGHQGDQRQDLHPDRQRAAAASRLVPARRLLAVSTRSRRPAPGKDSLATTG